MLSRHAIAGALAVATAGCTLLTPLSDLEDGDGAAFGNPERIATDQGVTGIALDSTHVYWANPTRDWVSRAPKASSDAATVIQVSQPPAPSEIAVLGGRVFAAGGSGYKGIFSYAPDGSSVSQVAGYANVSRMIAQSAIFVAMDGSSSDDNEITRYASDGSGSRVYFLRAAALPKALTFDGEYVYYYSASTPGAIQRVALGGSPTVFAPEAEIADLVADGAAVYALTVAGRLVAHPLPTGGPVELAAGLVGAQRIAVDDAALYVTAAGLSDGAGRVVRIPKAGGAAHDLAAGQPGPRAIAVDQSGVYWVNAASGTVMRVARR